MSLFAITPTRDLNLLYIILDSLFIILLLILLILKKKYITTLWSIFGGILYFIVDFGGFYLLAHSRKIFIHDQLANGLNTALVLLWMSLSYGITNFAFIWLCIQKDKDLKMFLLLIIGWWLIAPTLATLGGEATIKTIRSTGEYHGLMALILLIGYLILIIYNLFHNNQIPIFKLILIGFMVQFSWEFALLINQIRPFNKDSIFTLMIDSLIETNLGMPIIYPIYLLISKKYNDDFTKKTAYENN